MQPHKHHEGEISLELVQKITHDLMQCWQDVVTLPELKYKADVNCYENWSYALHDAVIRLSRVEDRVRYGIVTEEYDGKVVDICLSIIDDYQQAKAKNFINPDYVA